MSQEEIGNTEDTAKFVNEIMQKLNITDEMKMKMITSPPISLFELNIKAIVSSLKAVQAAGDAKLISEKEEADIVAQLTAAMTYNMIVLENALAIQFHCIDEKSKTIVSPISLNPEKKHMVADLIESMSRAATSLMKSTMVISDKKPESTSLDETLEKLKNMHNPLK